MLWSKHNASEKKINKDPLFSSLCSRPGSGILLAKHSTAQHNTVQHSITATICLYISVPEFLSRIHRGILVSDLKPRLALSQPGTSSSSLERTPLRVMLYQAPLSLTGTGRIRELKRETCNSQAYTNATYFAFRLQRTSKEADPAETNRFQLWARWWYAGLHRGEMMGFANSSRSLRLDTRYLTFKPNFLRPRFTQRNFLWSSEKGEKKTKKTPFGLELSLRFTKANRGWPIKVSIRGAAAWPLGCSSWFMVT